jgi:cyclopropane-fatty-acyl-phospholipid synthase
MTSAHIPDSVPPVKAGASTQAIQHHYDLGNDFYRLWLDPSMTYSCAMWEPGDDLESAQLRKLDYLCREATSHGRRRILDVGCGWGSALHRLQTHDEADEVVGLTLSAAQRDHIEATKSKNMEVHLEHWADHTPIEPYDGILSIGAFEHFARMGLTPEEKLTAYRQFFAWARDRLRPGGCLAVQTIAIGFAPFKLDALREAMFIATQIFLESDLSQVADLPLASAKHFEVLHMRTGRLHYARTCAEWLERLRRNRNQVEEIAGPEAFETYDRYLDICVRHFEAGYFTLLRFSFLRVN